MRGETMDATGRIKIIATAIVLAVLCSLPIFSGTTACAAPLVSQFLSGDSNAQQVMNGTPYAMNDPSWTDSQSNQNRNTFAYKIFTGFLMLGYQTEMGYLYGMNDQQLRALHAFQGRNALTVSNSVDAACLSRLDQLLVQREQELAPLAAEFPLYDHMQPLHPNDISKDTLAAIYALPMSVLPQSLQLSTYETVQCIA